MNTNRLSRFLVIALLSSCASHCGEAPTFVTTQGVEVFAPVDGRMTQERLSAALDAFGQLAVERHLLKSADLTELWTRFDIQLVNWHELHDYCENPDSQGCLERQHFRKSTMIVTDTPCVQDSVVHELGHVIATWHGDDTHNDKRIFGVSGGAGSYEIKAMNVVIKLCN